MIRIEPLAHRELPTARRLHAVFLPACAQEAALLGLQDFAPLARTAEDIQRSGDMHMGALRGDELLGAISIGPDDEPGQLCITSLVVHPAHQRQGAARALLAEVLRLGATQVFAVSTAAANAPALALYREFGFVAYRHGVMGCEFLPVVKLRRSPAETAPGRPGVDGRQA